MSARKSIKSVIVRTDSLRKLGPHWERRFKDLRGQIEAHIDEIDKFRAIDIYDGIDELVIRLESLDLSDLYAIREKLKDIVEPFIDNRKKIVKEWGLAKFVLEEVPDEREFSLRHVESPQENKRKRRRGGIRK
jgi:hypothetical protein